MATNLFTDFAETVGTMAFWAIVVIILGLVVALHRRRDEVIGESREPSQKSYDAVGRMLTEQAEVEERERRFRAWRGELDNTEAIWTNEEVGKR